MIIWLVGLSGSGKTTIGSLLVRLIRAQSKNVLFLDGDMLREIWGDKLGHDLAGREENARRISYLSRLLDQQGLHVVAAVLSIFPDWQRWNRQNFSNYFQVFLDVDMETLKRRDPKGIYAKAIRGEIHNVVGVDMEFPTPVETDMTIACRDWELSPDQIASKVFERVKDALLNSSTK